MAVIIRQKDIKIYSMKNITIVSGVLVVFGVGVFGVSSVFAHGFGMMGRVGFRF